MTLSSVEVFDPASVTWCSSEPLPVALHGLAVGVVGATLFVLGGSSRAGDIANSGDVMSRRP